MGRGYAHLAAAVPCGAGRGGFARAGALQLDGEEEDGWLEVRSQRLGLGEVDARAERRNKRHCVAQCRRLLARARVRRWCVAETEADAEHASCDAQHVHARHGWRGAEAGSEARRQR